MRARPKKSPATQAKIDGKPIVGQQYTSQYSWLQPLESLAKLESHQNVETINFLFSLRLMKHLDHFLADVVANNCVTYFSFPFSVRLISRKRQNLSTVLPPPPISPLNMVKDVAYSREFNMMYLLIDEQEIWVYYTRYCTLTGMP